MRSLLCVSAAVFGFLAVHHGQAQAQDLSSIREAAAPRKAALGAAAVKPRPPFSAIGRVNRRPGGFCSGVLVARDKVLTTASCLYNRSMGRWFPAEDVYFLAGYHLGQHIEMRRVAAIETPRGIAMKRSGVPRRAKDDWAVLSLRRPIQANHVIRPVERIRLRARPRPQHLGTLVRAGFGPKRPHALSRSDCRAIAFFNRATLMHDCGATFADSGFPILVETAEGWRVLGLQMASYRANAPENGVGMALVVTAMGSPTEVRW